MICRPRLTHPHQSHVLHRCLMLVLALSVTGALHAGDAGLTVRPATTPYLNLPPAPPVPNGAFTVTAAFPNLYFQGAIAVRAVPGTNLLWVIEREGRIWSFENNPSTTTKTLVLDLNDDDVDPNDATPNSGHLTGGTRWWCQGWDDCGLMGLAFHPQFNQAGSPNRGYFYLAYQAKSIPPDVGDNNIYRPDSGFAARNTSNRVARFTLPDNSLSANPASEQILLDQPDPHLWHNGGDLFFDTQGFLYTCNGDGGSAYDPYQNSQRINKGLFAGVLRIDVDWTPGSTRSHAPPARQAGQPTLYPGYGIPNDNPWVGIPGVLEEFYAIGLRSPHRMTYDAVTGQIVVGDIGQGRREELTLITRGSNHQWGYLEGFANKSVDGSIKNERIPPTYVVASAAAAGASNASLSYAAPATDTGLPPGMLAVGDRVRIGSQVLQIATLSPYPHTSVTFATPLSQAVAAGSALARTTGFTVSGAITSTGENGEIPSGLGTTTLPVSGTGLLAIGSSVSFAVANAVGSYQIIAATTSGGNTTGITVRPRIPATATVPVGTWVDRLTLIGSEQAPIADFNHGGAFGFNSILGGYIYRGSAHPSLSGAYLFADNARGTIYKLTGLGSVNPTIELLCTFPSYPVFDASGYRGLSGFGVDQNGELLICRMQQNGGAINQSTGQIYKLIRSSSTVIGTPIPTDLAATGAFATDGSGNLVQPLTPTAALIPYGVNSPLWSDNANKTRWIALPNPSGKTTGFTPATEQVTFSSTDALTFPSGTVFVKHFALEDWAYPDHQRKLETRLLVRSPDDTVYGVTYKWNTAGTQATLLGDGVSETYTLTRNDGSTFSQTWSYPSRDDCLSCHNGNARHVLGVNSRQLNGTFGYPSGVSDNQLHTWSVIGMFANPPSDSTIPTLTRLVKVDNANAPLADRARSWLDANCSHCHRPGGVHAEFDARYDTPLAQQGLINGVVNNPLGVSDPHVITPGDLTRSLLYVRDNSLAPGTKMPPLAKNQIDTAAMTTMAQWILGMSGSGNVAPVVNAGNDLTITLPSGALLDGTISDDGLPSGASVTSTWSVVSGPGSVTFTNASATDTNATFSAAGIYLLRLTASDTALSASDEVQVVVNPPPPAVAVRFNAGGPAVGSFAADPGAAGWTATDPAVVSISGVANAAPMEVYQSERFGAFTYTITGMPANTACTVRLHFCENWWTEPGKRVFHVSANGVNLLTDFDIFAAAGGRYIALVRDFPVTSAGDGSVAITFTTVTDHSKVSGIEVFTTSGTPTNLAPNVSAGPDLAVTLPAAAVLDATISDDGLPSGSTLTTTWSKVSGPGTVTFANAAAVDTSATFSAAGTYVLRLTASDSALTAGDDVQVVVSPIPPTNTAPNVNAGPDLAITLPAFAVLDATVSDDGLPNGSLSSTWTKVSGPGTVTFANAAAVDTNATFSAAGTYVLRLTASDSALNASDDVQVVVLPTPPTNTAPTVNAGPDLAITLPAGATLDATVSDDGLPSGSTLATTWTKVSGPGTVTFANAAAVDTNATFSSAGTYVLRLTASDSALSTNDDVQVVVSAPTLSAVRFNAGGPAVGTFAADPGAAGWTATDPTAVSLASVTNPAPMEVYQSERYGAFTYTITNLPANAACTLRLHFCENYWTQTGRRVFNVAANGTSLLSNFDIFAAAGGRYIALVREFTVTSLADGSLTIVFTTITDHSKVSGIEVLTSVAPPTNSAPNVNAGSDLAITLPAAAALDATVTDDGLPSGSILATTWTKVSGPGTVTFANAAAVDTSATFSAAGTYVLRLTASDSALSASDDVQVVVSPAPPTNTAPSVNAGPDLAITLPAGAALDATVGDDGLPSGSTLTTTWSKISGPGTVTFANAAAVDTNATFSVAGTYVLRLTASDSALSTSDDVQVVVAPTPPTNTAPSVNAGPDLAVTLPATAALDATVTDDGLPSGSTLTTTWTKVSGPGTVTFANAAAVDTGATFSAAGTYVLRLTASDSALSASDDVQVVVSASSQTGQILREWWTGISGTAVSNLTSIAAYPNSPTGSAMLTSFEAPTNVMDNYGTRVRGYVVPPVTGQYVFWIAGDDFCELYLGTSNSPASKVLIASVPGWSNSREWTKYPQQQSAAVTLTAGVSYYIEALHKEGGGGDNLAVGWQLPGGTQERPIPGNRLIPFNPASFIPPQVALTAPATGSQTMAPNPVTLSASASDSDGSVSKVEFLLNGSVVATITAPPYTTTLTGLAAGHYTVVARATDSDGLVVSSTSRWFTMLNADGTGLLRREWWSGIAGTGIAQLTTAPGYPGTPSDSDFRAVFEAPTDWADNYGTRLYGYVVAPTTGNYVFWIAGDDNCELWLSTNDSPAAKVRIATVPGWTTSREWTKYPAQQSVPIALTAGARYWIEALQKEGGGGDNLAVGWQLPSGTQERPIPGSRLMPPVISVAALPVGWSVRLR